MSDQPIFRLAKFQVIKVNPDKSEEQLYESIPIPDQSEVELNEGSDLPQGIQNYLKIFFYVKEAGIKGLVCRRKVYKGPICVNTENTEMGDFEPSEEVQSYGFKVMDTPSGFFVRGSFSTELAFLNNDNQILMKIKYPFQICKAK